MRLSPVLLLALSACNGDATEDDTGTPDDTNETDVSEDSEDSDSDTTVDPDDNDGDGHPASTDCNDNNPTIFPGAPELCDDVDQDCTPGEVAGRATFFPTAGGPAQDLSAALSDGGAGATLTEAGTLRLCGGAWSQGVSSNTALSIQPHADFPTPTWTTAGGITAAPLTVGEIALSAAPITLPTPHTHQFVGTSLGGTVSVQGGASVSLASVDLTGTINRVGASSATLTLTGVDMSGAATITGNFVLTATNLTATVSGAFADGLTVATIANATITASSGIALGNNANVLFESVTLTTALGGLTMNGPAGTVAITDSVFNVSGTGSAIAIGGATALAISDTDFTHTGTDPVGQVLVYISGTPAFGGSFTNVKLDAGGVRPGLHVRGPGAMAIEDSELTHYKDRLVFSENQDLVISDSVLQGDVRTGSAPTDTHGLVHFKGTGKTLTISNSELKNAWGTVAGAVYVEEGNAVVSDSSFEANRTNGGGGAIGFGAGSTGSLTVSGSEFSTNRAAYGGAISTAGNLTLSNSTFTENNGNSFGGAVMASTGNLAANGCTFTANSSQNGGAVAQNQNNGGNLVFTGGAFRRNAASNIGGAIAFGTSLSLVGVDLGTGADDNTPNDLQRMNGDHVKNGGASVTTSCTTSGCLP